MGSKGDAPAAPDYRGAAQEQAGASERIAREQTKANRPNVYTPFGSSEWQQGPGGQWTNQVNLDPAAQRALDDQQAITEGRSGIAKGMLGGAGQEMQTPEGFFDNLTPAGSVPQAGQYGSDLQRGQVGDAPQYQAEQIQRGLDFSGAGDVTAGGGYNPDFAQTQYDRQQSLAAPQQERAMTAMDTRLRNQGLAPGSSAYDNAMGDLRNQQGEVNSRMQQDAMRLGADEQQRQFGREMGVRQQGVSETGQQGSFANQAAAQAMGQQLGMGGQQFSQDMQRAQYADQQRQQDLSQQLAAGGQQFSEQQKQSNMQNQARQQQIAEQLQREGWSLNKINAMMSGQQVGMPNMPDFKSASAGETPQYLQAAGMMGDYGMDKFKIDSANAAKPWELLGGIGAAAAGSWMP